MNYLKLVIILLTSSTFCMNPLPKTSNSNAYMIIDPKEMSKDVIQAFEFLNEAKKTIEITLKNNEKLTHIKDVRALNGGYLMIFTLKSLKGNQYKIVPLTDIISIKST